MILSVDMDAFDTSIEERDRLELVGKPLIQSPLCSVREAKPAEDKP